MTLTISNNVLNLADLQQKMDETIFDYIDSKPNWDKAYIILDEMLEQTTKYFLNIVNSKGLPTPTTYWVIFMELNAKLIYFTTLALKNRTQKSNGITDELIANRFEIASKCLTNIHTDENELFLQEIKASFQEVSLREDYAGLNDRKAESCIEQFYEFAKAY